MLIDKKGYFYMKRFYFVWMVFALLIICVVSQGAKVSFDSNGYLTVDGKPFFPRALYGLSGGVAAMKRILPDVSGAKINCWLSPWAGEKSLKEILEFAHQNGMMVVPYISNASLVKGQLENNPKAKVETLARIKQRIIRLKNYPALLGWYIGDEIMDSGAKPQYIKLLTEAIHQVDPDHPVFLLPTTHYPSRNLWRQAQETCDAFLMDCYPIASPDYTNLRWLDRAMDVIEDSPHGNRLWVIVQAFNKKDFPGLRGSKQSRYPTESELRFMTFLPMIRGANGICWYFGCKRYNNKPNPFPDNPTFWKTLLNVMKEAALVSEVITAPKVTQGVTFLPLHIFGYSTVRRLPDGYMVFVANVLNRRTDIRIMMNFLTDKYELHKIIGQDTQIEISPKKVQITNIKPYGIAVFKLVEQKRK